MDTAPGKAQHSGAERPRAGEGAAGRQFRRVGVAPAALRARLHRCGSWPETCSAARPRLTDPDADHPSSQGARFQGREHEIRKSKGSIRSSKWPATACSTAARCSGAASCWPAPWARARPASLTGAAAEPLEDGPWSLEVGDAIPPYQTPSRFEKTVVRTVDNPKNEPRNSRARTPHHLLKGIITPERPALHHLPWRRAGHRPGPAQARHPRHGQAAAGVHPRGARALSDGVAHRLRRMRRQQRAAVLQRADPGQRAGAARPRLVLGMDRRAALHAARRGRRRSQGEVDHRRRRRLAASHPQRAARQGDGRRHGRDVPERRAHPARPGLSDAAVAARLRRQHERQVPAPGAGHRPAGADLLRGADLFAGPARRQGLPVLLPAGGEVLHHQPVARPRP